MCLSKAFIIKDNSQKLLLEEVSLLKIHDNKVQLESFFGEKREIEAKIKEVDFVKSRILLESTE